MNNFIFMTNYEKEVYAELVSWQQKMQGRPSFFNRISKKLQTKINGWIPEKVHNAITVTIREMIRGVLFGARHTTASPLRNISFQQREEDVPEYEFRESDHGQSEYDEHRG